MSRGIAILSLLFLCSCAFTDVNIRNEYSSRTVKKTKNNVRVYVHVDNKESRTVGVKKNGYGVDTAQVYLPRAQSRWLKSAIENELGAQGFAIVANRKRSEVVLDVKINQLFVEPDVGFWAASLVGIADLNVRVKVKTGHEYERNFVEVEETTEMIWSDSDIAERFNGAVSMCLSDISVRLNELVKSKIIKIVKR
ncbi:YajG family lipoprotein [Halobacteriovorax sp. XZX-3]|uniref:YajG family lipoprotein n=1 Tax=unclassified Halobacteriovorax TaxID=2639665 RepID=UPI003712C851